MAETKHTRENKERLRAEPHSKYERLLRDMYHQTLNIRRALVGNNIVVVGASSVGAAPTSPFST